MAHLVNHKARLAILIIISLGLIIGALAAMDRLAYSALETYQVVAEGLDNPRGLGFSPDGFLYVAEAGRGGETCFEIARPPGQEPPEGQANMVCGGRTGAITRVWPGAQQELVGGLPSMAGAPDQGNAAAGPHDVAFSEQGQAYLVTGLGAAPGARQEPAIPPDFTAGAMELGHLFQVAAEGKAEEVADIAGYEATANPDGGDLDSNPYGVLALADGQVVVDAGGNSLLQVDSRGRVSTLAVFPPRPVAAPPFIPPEALPPDGQIPMQAVPTAVAQGPDGAYYVSQLTGFPFPAGEGRIYRVLPGEEPEIYAT